MTKSYLEKPKESIKKRLEFINKLTRVQDTKNLHFHVLTKNNPQKKLKKKIQLHLQ